MISSASVRYERSIAARSRYRSVSFCEVQRSSAKTIANWRMVDLNGRGISSFSRRERVLRLVPTSFPSSSRDSPALLRKFARNAPNCFIDDLSHSFPECSPVFPSLLKNLSRVSGRQSRLWMEPLRQYKLFSQLV